MTYTSLYWKSDKVANQEFPKTIIIVFAEAFVNTAMTVLSSDLNQFNSVHTFMFYFSKIHYNIILPSMPSSPKHFFLDVYIPTTILYGLPSSQVCYRFHSFHHFNYSNNIRWRAQIMKVTIIHVPSLSYFFLFLQFKYTPLHFILANKSVDFSTKIMTLPSISCHTAW